MAIEEITLVEGQIPSQSAYSVAVRAGDLVFIAGHGPLDDQARTQGTDIIEQSRMTLENLQRVLRAAGGELFDVVQLTVYIANFDDYTGYNSVHETFFTKRPFPARTCIEAARLWGQVLVEVDAVAYLPRSVS